MDQEGVPAEASKTTPLFGAYRRGGYDPEQVDRYVADQAGRLEAAEHRAAEAERRLAAAVGQLRELHRRVAVLESEDRSPQPPSLDTLGERVQRILKEAWEGAYALRQAAETEVTELRDRATAEAEEIVATAEDRARQIDEEIERRRKAYLARLEEDRGRAVAQVSYLHEQRRAALSELLRVKELIEATVGDPGARLPAPTPEPETIGHRLPSTADSKAAIEALLEEPAFGPTPGTRPAPVSQPEPAPAPRAPQSQSQSQPQPPAASGPGVSAPRAADAAHHRPVHHRPGQPEIPVGQEMEDQAAVVARRTALLARAGIVLEDQEPEHPSVTVRSLGALVEETRSVKEQADPRRGVRRLGDDEPQPAPPGEPAAGVFDFDED